MTIVTEAIADYSMGANSILDPRRDLELEAVVDFARSPLRWLLLNVIRSEEVWRLPLHFLFDKQQEKPGEVTHRAFLDCKTQLPLFITEDEQSRLAGGSRSEYPG